jgi:hypothetical protein
MLADATSACAFATSDVPTSWWTGFLRGAASQAVGGGGSQENGTQTLFEASRTQVSELSKRGLMYAVVPLVYIDRILVDVHHTFAAAGDDNA